MFGRAVHGGQQTSPGVKSWRFRKSQGFTEKRSGQGQLKVTSKVKKVSTPEKTQGALSGVLAVTSFTEEKNGNKRLTERHVRIRHESNVGWPKWCHVGKSIVVVIREREKNRKFLFWFRRPTSCPESQRRCKALSQHFWCTRLVSFPSPPPQPSKLLHNQGKTFTIRAKHSFDLHTKPVTKLLFFKSQTQSTWMAWSLKPVWTSKAYRRLTVTITTKSFKHLP